MCTCTCVSRAQHGFYACDGRGKQRTCMSRKRSNVAGCMIKVVGEVMQTQSLTPLIICQDLKPSKSSTAVVGPLRSLLVEPFRGRAHRTAFAHVNRSCNDSTDPGPGIPRQGM